MPISDSTLDSGVPPPRPIRLAYVVSHPIQYQAELLRRVAADPEIDLTVLFCSDFSLRAYRDSGFGVAVSWDIPLTEGYRHQVLRRWRETTDPRPLAPISRGFLRALSRGVDGHSFDAVWTHGYNTVNTMHAILTANALGIPVLVRAESWLNDRERSPVKLRIKRAFFDMLRPLITAVLPIGTRNAEYWAHYFGESFPSFLVPYAVNNDFFAAGLAQAAPAQPSLRAELGLDPGRPVILFASKLQERKHCNHLLEAYLQMLDGADPAHAPYLVVVGDGEQVPQLKQRVADTGATTVRFAGFRNQRELPGFFGLATVFVLPSRHEAWGLIVNEAMACSLPVIVSDEVGCAVDLVRDGVNGYIFPAGDIAALRTALEAVLQPGRAAQMGEQSRRRIDEWSYREDVAGLKQALAYATKLPLRQSAASSAPHQAREHAHADPAL